MFQWTAKMGRIGFFLTIFAFIGGLSPSTWSATPSSQRLPKNHLVENHFLTFQSELEPFSSPIARDLTINDEFISPIDQILSESFWISLPDQTQILQTSAPTGEKRWQFPVGTQVAHEIKFKDAHQTLFELRILEKLPGEVWGFGAYILNPNGDDDLILQTEAMEQRRELKLGSPEGREWLVKIAPLRQRTCAGCHQATTSNPAPEGEADKVGPCGFTAANPFVTGEWVQKFRAAKGYSPILER